jgi:SAM-dependent methyltransferase
MSPRRNTDIQNKSLWRVSYVVTRLLGRIIGKRCLLSFLLDLSWLSRRLAFEQSCKIVGGDTLLSCSALSKNQFEKEVTSGSSLLDIGCGSGRWVDIGIKHGVDIVGIDSDIHSITTCQAKFPRAKFFHGTLEDYLVANPNAKFDFVLLSHLLEHIEDPELLLERITLISRHVLIEVPDFDSDPLNHIRVLFNRPFYTDNDHKYEFQIEELLYILNKVGIKVKTVLKKGGMIFVHGTIA